METGSGATDSVLIDADLECIGCGYNLRTLSRDAKCPECAAPVADSVDAFPPAFSFRRWSSIRWIRLGLLLWVLSILAWAGGLIYCTMRVAWATNLWIAARWGSHALTQGVFGWMIELCAVLCICRGITSEFRGWRRHVAAAAFCIAALACIPSVTFTYLLYSRRRGIPYWFDYFLDPFMTFGRPAALAIIAVLLLLITTSRHSLLVRAALGYLILSLCMPFIGAACELIWAFINVDPDFSMYRWFWSELGRTEFALNSAATTIAILIVDRGLRTPLKTQEKSQAALDGYSSLDRSTAFN